MPPFHIDSRNHDKPHITLSNTDHQHTKLATAYILERNYSKLLRQPRDLCKSWPFDGLALFKVTDIFIKNVIPIDFPEINSVHPVIHVGHTVRAYRQPPNMITKPKHAARPFVDEHDESVIEVSVVLSHRNRGRSWQRLTQFKEVPAREVESKPLRDFEDDDNTLIEALHKRITHHIIWQHFQYYFHGLVNSMQVLPRTTIFEECSSDIFVTRLFSIYCPNMLSCRARQFRDGAFRNCILNLTHAHAGLNWPFAVVSYTRNMRSLPISLPTFTTIL